VKPLVAVVGPTAIGKSDFAIDIAQRFQGEIISADSRQIYRFMDIGTAKPSLADLSIVQHHLIDIVDPDEDFSLALFQSYTQRAIEQIHQRGNLPLLVGGSGLYIWSVLEGWSMPQVQPDYQLRDNLEKRAAVEGNFALYQELQKADPAAATKIMPNNIRRVIRALEVYLKTGKPASQSWEKKGCSYPFIIIGLTTERHDLYHRIDSRVYEMIKQGLLDEVKSLVEKGYHKDLPSMSSVGYRQIALFLEGEMDLATAIEKIKNSTHRIARHQYAWFHLSDERIHWLNIKCDIVSEAEGVIRSFLQ
jgi:tRNA dimethylallyltransferase